MSETSTAMVSSVHNSLSTRRTLSRSPTTLTATSIDLKKSSESLRIQGKLPGNVEDYHYMLFCVMSSKRESRFLEKLDDIERGIHVKREKQLEELGWIPLKTSEEFNIGQEHGYFGVAYCRLKNKSAEIVIAHRGTCFDERGNILADIAIAEGEVPKIVTEAAFKYITELFGNQNFYDGSITTSKKLQINKKYRITKITHTGFSLGGFIAGACTGLTNYPIIKAITFDAPGIGNLNVNKSKVATRITNYVTKPNLVNTCNLHIGEIRELCIEYECSQLPEKIKFKLDLTDLGFEFSKQLPEHHSPDELREWLKHGEDQKQRRESFKIVIDELDQTLLTHNLNKIILAIEESVYKIGKWEYQRVYKWPDACNQIIYGQEPEAPSSFTHFGVDSFSSAILSLFSVGIHVSKHIASSALWQITMKFDEYRQVVGVIGIHHERDNRIYYTQEELGATYLVGGMGLKQAKKMSLQDAEASGTVGPREMVGFQLEDVNDKGNCFYEAVVDQLQLIGDGFIETVPEGTEPHNSLRLNIQGQKFHDEEWADDRMFEQFSRNFNDLILAVIDTRNPQAGFICYYYEDNGVITNTGEMQIPDRLIIRIAATGNHFLSVRGHPVLKNGAIHAAFSGTVSGAIQGLELSRQKDIKIFREQTGIKKKHAFTEIRNSSSSLRPSGTYVSTLYPARGAAPTVYSSQLTAERSSALRSVMGGDSSIRSRSLVEPRPLISIHRSLSTSSPMETVVYRRVLKDSERSFPVSQDGITRRNVLASASTPVTSLHPLFQQSLPLPSSVVSASLLTPPSVPSMLPPSTSIPTTSITSISPLSSRPSSTTTPITTASAPTTISTTGTLESLVSGPPLLLRGISVDERGAPMLPVFQATRQKAPLLTSVQPAPTTTSTNTLRRVSEEQRP